MKARKLVLTLIASLALVSFAANVQAAGAANFWRSPSGNIACRYYPAIEAVTCQTDNDRYAVAVERYGSKAFRTYYRWIPSWALRLDYGGNWTGPGFRCQSQLYGMTCRTTGGHGFGINRDDVVKW